mmetsp:Transcript_4409/g.12744  ORF Transcript_4409/g.12744 Transcript_4409/m.12744 type:complete len:216 (-) Transcript_4409:127-774(-)
MASSSFSSANSASASFRSTLRRCLAAFLLSSSSLVRRSTMLERLPSSSLVRFFSASSLARKAVWRSASRCMSLPACSRSFSRRAAFSCRAWKAASFSSSSLVPVVFIFSTSALPRRAFSQVAFLPPSIATSQSVASPTSAARSLKLAPAMSGCLISRWRLSLGSREAIEPPSGRTPFGLVSKGMPLSSFALLYQSRKPSFTTKCSFFQPLSLPAC